MRIGDVIHRLRKERKMTLLQLSEASGVALATLSRIENGKMTGTLDSHMAMCKAFEITLPELYKDLSSSKKTLEVQTKKNRAADVSIHDKKSSSEILVSRAMEKKMMPTLVKIHVGGVTHKEENKSGVEKFIYILEGKIEAFVGEEKYNLVKDDTLYFDSSLAHYFKNIGNGDSRLISITCPPAL